MYRRLVTFALLVVTVAVTALVIPLALSARDNVRAGNLAAVAEQAREVADFWEARARSGGTGSDDGSGSGGDDGSGSAGVDPDDVTAPVVDVPGGPGEVALVHPDGTVLGGPIPDAAAAVVASAAHGRSASVDVGGQGFAAAPAVFGEESIGVVLVMADAARMREGLGGRLAALAGLCAVLLVGSGVAAWALARRTARPIREVAATADALAAGDLAARAQPSGIVEVDDVGVALNRLAARVQELLAEEREAAAELAHQLRTPLTVLSADIDAVADPQVRQRLVDDALTLRRTADEIITSARRAAREGLRASCDAAAVVAERAEFWRVLAEFQDRPMTVTGTEAGPLPVRLTEYDLATAVDILLQNVFTHTEEGVALAISVTPARDGLVEVTVTDGGPGFPSSPDLEPRAGSTGLGLAIAERLARASGGSLVRASGPGRGALVRIRLGRAAA